MSTPGRTLTWLHLSDLHLCSPRDGGAGEVVLRRLLDDLEALRDDQHLRPDLLFMTGDLAFGQIPDQPLADQLRDGWAWIEKVRELYGLSAEDVFLVPGNHDVDRGEVQEMQQHWLRSLASENDNARVRQLLQQGGNDWQACMQPAMPTSSPAMRRLTAKMPCPPSSTRHSPIVCQKCPVVGSTHRADEIRPHIKKVDANRHEPSSFEP